jgi:hypothetical protein
MLEIDRILLQTIELVLQAIVALALLHIQSFKIFASTAAAFGKLKRTRREVDKKACYEKPDCQRDDKWNYAFYYSYAIHFQLLPALQ